jgi:2-C-methyl-D-erythritol 4-phosphate cytidylyltransferase
MVHVTWGIIIACGKDEQIAPEVDTPFLNLGSKPVLTYSLLTFEQCPEVNGVVVVVSKDRIDSVTGMTQMFGFSKVQKIVAGTGQRQSSVVNGLRALDEEVSIVCVHEASRPGLTVELLSETIKAAKRYGSGVAAMEIKETVKAVEKGLTASKTLHNGALWGVQTPQSFRRDLLEKGYGAASKKRISVEDDSSAYELTGEEVHLVESIPANMKIRTPGDFNLAAALMRV